MNPLANMNKAFDEAGVNPAVAYSFLVPIAFGFLLYVLYEGR